MKAATRKTTLRTAHDLILIMGLAFALALGLAATHRTTHAGSLPLLTAILIATAAA